MTRRYEPEGRSHLVLQTLDERGALSMPRLFRELKIVEHGAMRRKLFYILEALQTDGFVLRNSRERWIITNAGIQALARLRAGETIEFLEDAA